MVLRVYVADDEEQLTRKAVFVSPFEERSPLMAKASRTTVPILTNDSQRAGVVRVLGNEEDIGMHLAVSCGAGDAGRFGFWAEYAAEGGLAGADRVAFG